MPLVSGMYKITATGKLPHPVTLHVQHCAVIEDGKFPHFIVSRDEYPPYRFKQLDHGDFSTPNVGKIQLSEFCYLAVLYDYFEWYIELYLHVFCSQYDLHTQHVTFLCI